MGSVEVKSTSLGVAWFSELAKLASRRPLHSDSSEKVRCRVRLGDWRQRAQGSEVVLGSRRRGGRSYSRSGLDPHRVSLRRLPRVVHDDQLLQVVLDCAFVGAARGAQVPQRRPQPRLPEHVLGVGVDVPEDTTQN